MYGIAYYFTESLFIDLLIKIINVFNKPFFVFSFPYLMFCSMTSHLQTSGKNVFYISCLIFFQNFTINLSFKISRSIYSILQHCKSKVNLNLAVTLFKHVKYLALNKSCVCKKLDILCSNMFNRKYQTYINLKHVKHKGAKHTDV